MLEFDSGKVSARKKRGPRSTRYTDTWLVVTYTRMYSLLAEEITVLKTALLKVMNDILLNMNKQHVTILVLLNLSAAFDTVDHDILLIRLSSKLGLNGNALG